MHPAISHHYTTVDDLNIHYLEAGEGEAIVFLHGWPTSAYLWRNILPGLAKKYRVIAIDLPGFGQSDKHPEDSYSFRYYNRVLTGFLANLQIDQLTLGLHDLGGPIGLSWLVQNMDRVDRLILFNTLVYPPFSWAVKLFTLSTMLPGVKSWLSAPNGIRRAMRFGVYQKDRLTDEAIRNYQAPFQSLDARKALLKTVQRLSGKGFEEIKQKLPSFAGPVQIIYGERDKILPQVKNTMAAVKKDLPQARQYSFPNCGHFLQEEEPEKIVELVATFMEAHP